MSAAFKNFKKKLSQSELRKYLNEHKNKDKPVKKVESPLAKYNELGQLTCILCKSIVRSEAVWTVHVNAKQHKQNVELAKKLKDRTNNFTMALKRPLTPPLPEVPEKKIKGILKNANPVPATTTTSTIEVDPTDESRNKNDLPDDFFDSKGLSGNGVSSINLQNTQKKQEAEESEAQKGKEVLPEGFFDDPKLDAKARNQEYKDPIEEEWEKFVKAIKEADNESNAIIAEDQEEATTERQIDEIDEQIKIMSRVLDLEKKKEQIISITEVATTNKEDEDVEVEEDFDEYLDWRSKKSFK